MKEFYIYILFIIIIILYLLYLIYTINNTINEKFANINFYADIYDELNNTIIKPTVWYAFDDVRYNNNEMYANINIYKKTNTPNRDNYYYNKYKLIKYNNLEVKNNPNTISTNLPELYRIGEKSVYFNGYSYLKTGNTSDIDYVNLNNKSFTICWWSYVNYPYTDVNGRWIYTKQSNIKEYGCILHIGYRDNNTFSFDFWGDSIEIRDIPNILGKHYKKWIFFAVTYNASNKKKEVFIFDANDKSNEHRHYTNYAKGHLQPSRFEKDTFYSIGKNPSTNAFFLGYITNFRIYTNLRDEVLSLNQLKCIYKNTTNNTEIFTSQYNLDDNAAIFTPSFDYEVRKYPLSYLRSENITINTYSQTGINGNSIAYYGINNITDINNLQYSIYFSSMNNENNNPSRLFDGNIGNENSYLNNNNIGCEFENGTYNTNGTYIGNNLYSLNKENKFFGEWLEIRFEYAFKLASYGFIAIKGFENCAPGCWELYGRNDNSIYYKIDYNDDNNVLNFTIGDYNNNFSYYGVDIDNTQSYKNYLFIFKRLALGRNTNANNNNKTLKFIEILMFSKVNN
jgi:hypothetical protein